MQTVIRKRKVKGQMGRGNHGTKGPGVPAEKIRLGRFYTDSRMRLQDDINLLIVPKLSLIAIAPGYLLTYIFNAHCVPNTRDTSIEKMGMSLHCWTQYLIAV